MNNCRTRALLAVTGVLFLVAPAPSSAGRQEGPPTAPAAVENRRIVSTTPADTCPGDLVANGDFSAGLVTGYLGLGGTEDNWFAASRSPQVLAAGGCDTGNTGSIGLLGNTSEGDAIEQLLPGAGFEPGHTYQISMCVRNPPLPVTQVNIAARVGYTRFRVRASNTLLGSYTDPAGVIIDETAQISGSGWATVQLVNWTAPLAYARITINPFNDHAWPDTSYGEIDRICVIDVTPPPPPEWCAGNLIQNGDFTDGLVTGYLGLGGNEDHWSAASRSPQVMSPGGCDSGNIGSIGVLGNTSEGDAMEQVLSGAGFESGHLYQVTICLRNPPLPPTQVNIAARVGYTRFRVRASNTLLGSYADPAGVIVGETGQITSPAWTSTVLLNWTAGANYSRITINPFNDVAWPDTSYGEIDRICVQDVSPSMSYAFRGGWNLVSQPADVPDDTVAHLFPAATSAAYAYVPDSGYVASPAFAKGKGYWLKFPSAAAIPVLGTPDLYEELSVSAGWNLVGSVSVPVGVSDVTSVPNTMTVSQFFAYAGSYGVADSLRPGSGYWVKVSQDGLLVLSGTPLAVPGSKVRIIATAELPPPPPASPELGRTHAPAAYALGQNYPNPFNPATTIAVELPVASAVSLRIYNILGEEVATVLDLQPMDAGSHSFSFDASHLPSGVYVYRVMVRPAPGEDRTASFTSAKKMLLVR